MKKLIKKIVKKSAKKAKAKKTAKKHSFKKKKGGWDPTKDPNAKREAAQYENPIVSREHILAYLETQDCPMGFKSLLAIFKLETPDQIEALRRRLRAMERDGQILQNRRGKYGVIDQLELIRGRVIGHREGFGFLSPDEEGISDLFLSAGQMRRVLHGDVVLARVARIDSRSRQEASIVEILTRNTQTLVGRYYEEAGVGFVEPANRRIAQSVMVTPMDNINPDIGQTVVVKITEQPTFRHPPIGEITEILAHDLAIDLAIDVAIRSHDIPFEWSAEQLQEAAAFGESVPRQAYEGRSDIRDLPFVTIDGLDAQDFDDAVYCSPNPKGGWHLWVAIADVSYYVRAGSLLDEGAKDRGNSVYFPSRVVPMLPEALSNGLCSLRPKVDRLSLVCQMSINANGKVTRSHFYQAVMHSHARLTYDEVSDLLTDQHSQAAKDHADLAPHLQHLHDLYQVLLSQRTERGAIDFHFNEPYFEFNQKGQIGAIKVRTRTIAHRIIEECMLAANVSMARFMMRHKLPALFRIHSRPSPDKLSQLREFLNGLGLELKGGDKPCASDYARLLESIASRKDADLVQIVMLRSLSQAIYGAENEGHFALAYDAYGHFTSPIRRYPDLLVHRAITQHLSCQQTPQHNLPDVPIQALGEHCSTTERRADEAVRQVSDVLKCQFMQDKIGKVYQGMVTSVTNFGLFVQLKDIFIDGLVHITNLPEDYYHFDPIQHRLVGKRTNRRYALGDTVSVKVAQVDVDGKQIDLTLVPGISIKL